MSKFEVGQEVRCINPDCKFINYGGIYKVTATYNDGSIRLQGASSSYGSKHFELAEYPTVEPVLEIEGLLSAVEVTQAVIDKVPLEYRRSDKHKWHRIVSPEVLSIDTILKGKFRKYIERIKINGVEIVKPTIETKEHIVDVNRLSYSININLRHVTKVHGEYAGAPLWATAEDAHAALTAILAPFGVTPQPLSEMSL